MPVKGVRNWLLIFNNLWIALSTKVAHHCALVFRFRKHFFDKITRLTGRGRMKDYWSAPRFRGIAQCLCFWTPFRYIAMANKFLEHEFDFPEAKKSLFKGKNCLSGGKMNFSDARNNFSQDGFDFPEAENNLFETKKNCSEGKKNLFEGKNNFS